MKNLKMPYSEKDSHWADYPDYVRKEKKIGKYIVELVGGTDRGAFIKIWETENEFSQDGWLLVDNKKYYMRFDRGHYMYYENAIEVYTYMLTVEDVSRFIFENV